MPTLIGLIFLISASYFLLKDDSDCLFGLLIFATLFHASSLVSGSFGIPLYYVVAPAFILQSFLRRNGKVSVFKGKRWLLAFGLFGISSAICFPLLFPGVGVYDPKIGIDSGFLERVPLHLNGGNFVQAGCLGVSVLVIFASGYRTVSVELSEKVLNWAFYTLVSIIAIQFIFLRVGIPFPYSLINNNNAYLLGNPDLARGMFRPNGTYAEPSLAGATLTAFTAAFFAEFMKGKKALKKLTLGVLAVLVVSSTSSILALVVSMVAISTGHPIVRQGFVDLTRLKRLSILVAFVVLVAVALMIPPVRDSLVEQTVEKGASHSFLVRTAADFYAVQLASETKWIGVGLGSNRPSSLLASLVSNTGLAGLLLFLIMFVLVVRNCPPDKPAIKWMAWTLLINMALGIPDITYPFLWLLMAMAVLTSKSASVDERIYANVLRPSLPPPRFEPHTSPR